jgi:hypothetical protein
MESAMEKMVRYPVGQQSFEMLRSEGYLYVDKTRFIELLLNGSRFNFLGRPRRFGKSLFLSMLKCFFQGKRELFKGLYADSMDWNWQPHPVLHLDLNIETYKSEGNLEEVLSHQLRIWEDEFGLEKHTDNLSLRFNDVIRGAYQRTGRGVVILVDEYDKPLVNNLHDNSSFESYREQLGSFYSNLKSCAEYIKLVFLTGVSRFAKLSVFSGLNNLRDISFDNQFSDICGITGQELLDNFGQGISRLSEFYGTDKDETCNTLKRYYDGYRFSTRGKEIYNPFSILIAMQREEYGNYWIQSGNPTLLLEQLKKYDVNLEDVLNAECTAQELSGLDLSAPSPVALLYQTGYLTIKDTSGISMLKLGIPNQEVKEGFLSFLLPYYANLHGEQSQFCVSKFVREFRNGDVEDFMKRLQAMFASVPYDMAMEKEQNIHSALLILMMLVGLEVETEYRTANGRIDLFVKTESYYYIIELKLKGTAEEALEQIERKNYALPFSLDSRKQILIGANFSTATRTIDNWITKS